MSEHKSASSRRRRSPPNLSSGTRSSRRRAPQAGHYQDLRSNTIAEDWSIQSGRIARMNDPKEDDQIHRFVETLTQESAFTSSTSLAIAAGTYITLSALPNSSTYTALFDQYRICQVEVWAIPTGTSQAASEAVLFKSVVDYDNTSTTATTTYFDSFSNVHTTTLLNGHYRRFTPHVAMSAYSGAFTSFANRSLQWIDCGSPAVQHYGLKYYIDQTTAAVPVDMVWRVWLEFRNKI